jgi:hypothetical protein
MIAPVRQTRNEEKPSALPEVDWHAILRQQSFWRDFTPVNRLAPNWTHRIQWAGDRRNGMECRVLGGNGTRAVLVQAEDGAMFILETRRLRKVRPAVASNYAN